jgi:hypothetical protein
MGTSCIEKHLSQQKTSYADYTKNVCFVNSNSLSSKDYPSFFYPKLAEISKTFLPKLDTVYYIHNFKGVKGGTLFRSAF